METTEDYQGFEIKIIRDEYPLNPFEDFDGEPSLMFESGRNNKKDYSKGEIDRYLSDYLTDNQITKHQKTILALLDIPKRDFDLDYPLNEYSKQERADELKRELSEFISESIANKVSFCDNFGITYYLGTSRGYSQGDWANVFVIITDNDREILGIAPKDDFKACEGTFKLFGYWAWGDVYGYSVEDKEGNEIDSCWEFYGDNHEESGLMEMAKNAIDCHISDKLKEHCKQVKAYIRNHVPLEKRVALGG